MFFDIACTQAHIACKGVESGQGILINDSNEVAVQTFDVEGLHLFDMLFPDFADSESACPLRLPILFFLLPSRNGPATSKRK